VGRVRLAAWLVGLFVLLAASAPLVLSAQTRRTAPATPLSRTPDGQPDVQGYWGSDAYTQDLETGLPDEETNAIQGRGPVDKSKAISRIVDPPDGKIPYQPWAEERRLRIPTFRRGESSRGEPKTARDIRPQTFCLIGLPRLNWYSDYRIIQTPGYVVMAWEWSHAFRVIPLDANRPHPPDDVKLSMGDARGHWEGNTLVVDTANINDWDWLDATGTFHSDAMTMVERFAFSDSNTMEYTITITDPKALTRPFTIKLPYQRVNRRADFEMYEEACVEGTKSADTVGFSVR
jgi:hypothetical protein